MMDTNINQREKAIHLLNLFKIERTENFTDHPIEVVEESDTKVSYRNGNEMLVVTFHEKEQCVTCEIYNKQGDDFKPSDKFPTKWIFDENEHWVWKNQILKRNLKSCINNDEDAYKTSERFAGAALDRLRKI